MISFDNFFTMHCRSSMSPLHFLGPCSICFPRGMVNKSPLLGGGWTSFLTNETWPSLHPFIWNSIVLASSKFSAKVVLATLFTNMEMEVGRALAYTLICNSWVGLSSGWNLLRIVVNRWLKSLTFSFYFMVVANNSAIKDPIVVSSTNLSKKSFWNFVQLVMDPTGKLKYHVEVDSQRYRGKSCTLHLHVGHSSI